MVTDERVNGCAPLAGRWLANRYPRGGRRTICVPRPERNLTMNTTAIRTDSRPALRVPGYLSVRAAAELLGIREPSVPELVERPRLAPARLGRLHFLPSAVVEAYRGERRQRARRRGQHRALRARAA